MEFFQSVRGAWVVVSFLLLYRVVRNVDVRAAMGNES